MKELDRHSLNMSKYSIKEIYIGMKKDVTKTISESDIHTYVEPIASFNHLYVNAEAC